MCRLERIAHRLLWQVRGSPSPRIQRQTVREFRVSRAKPSQPNWAPSGPHDDIRALSRGME